MHCASSKEGTAHIVQEHYTLLFSKTVRYSTECANGTLRDPHGNPCVVCTCAYFGILSPTTLPLSLCVCECVCVCNHGAYFGIFSPTRPLTSGPE